MKRFVQSKTPIASVAKVISGYAFKSSEFSDQGIPVIKIKNIRTGSVDFSDTEYVSDQYLSLNPKYHVRSEDILISLTGSHVNQPNSVVGRVARYPRGLGIALLNQRAGKVIINDSNLCDKNFLYYHLFDEQTRRDIASLAHGAANQANVSPSQIESIKINLPPHPTQKKIGVILSAYDDLIGNNLRRIKIMEEMAQSLYREWFVKFRFPGHQKVKMVDSSLGKTPEGWHITTIGELCEYISRGISPQYREDIDCRVINQRCIRDNKLELELTRGNTKQVPEEKFVRFGDVLINSTGVGTLGRVAQVYRELRGHTVDSHVTIVRPAAGVNLDYFGVSMILLQTHFERLGAGATGQTELNRMRIAEMPLIAPPSAIQRKYGEMVSPMRSIAEVLNLKNDILRQTRDLLLPKLISGDLDVSELEITIPEDAV